MTIGIDAGPLLNGGGISGYVGPLVRSLIAMDRDSSYRLILRRSWLVHDSASRLEIMAPVVRVAFPDRILFFWWDRLGRVPPVQRDLWRSLDLFLATCLVVPVLPRGRVVSIVYDLTPLRQPQFFPNRDRFRRQVERLVNRSAALIAISRRTQEDMVELLGADPARIHVVYPAADARFTPVFDATSRDAVLERHGIRPPYLLYVGSLGPHKNVGTLVRVFQRLKQARRIEHRLVLCGKREWGPEVVRDTRHLVASGDCVILDFVPNTDLPALYHGADAFVFLSLYEGFGLPPLEAMACGIPVVASNAGSLPEVVGDAGILVNPIDEPAIETALACVLSDHELRQDLRVRGLRQAARFSWAEAARQTLKVFDAARGAR